MSFSAGKNLENNVNVAEAQTLSNKTLDNTNAVNGAPIQDSTITNASIVSPEKLQMKSYADLATAQADLGNRSGGELVYVSDIKKTYQVNDDGLGTKTLAEISGGQGGVNYIENSDFEQGVDGYVESGLNFTIDQTKVAGEVLRGEASAKLSKLAVDATGAEISVPFTVSRADLAKKLTISFEYDASDAAYADDDIQVYVKQDPNGTPSVIRINGEDLKGGKGTHYAQFQTDVSQTEYELVFKVNSANASAYDVIIDDVKVGPRELAKGTIVTDWKQFPFVLKGTVTDPTPGAGAVTRSYWRRVGDEMEIRVSYIQTVSGSSGSGVYFIEIPEGYKVDTVKFHNVANTSTSAGGWATGFAIGGEYIGNTIIDPIANTITIYAGNENINPEPIAAGTNFDLANSNVRFSFLVRIPIQGWSSNTVMSEDLGGREIYVKGDGSSTALANGIKTISFTSTIEDTTASFNGTTFTVPESGLYVVSFGATSEITTVDQNFIGNLYKNNALVRRLWDHRNKMFDTQNSRLTGNGCATLRFEKGDEITFIIEGNLLGIDLFDADFEITKIPSPQTILETETVAASYSTNSGQSILDTDTTILYDTLSADTHNAYDTSTGEYIVPVSGFYQINASATHDTSLGNMVAGTIYRLRINKNGSRIKENSYKVPNTTGIFVNTATISEIDYFSKGDVIEISTINDASDPMTVDIVLNSSNSRNTFSIARIK